MMHLAPDEVRAMDYEDVVHLWASAAIEADEFKKKTAPPSTPGSRTVTLRKR